jgi:hypothetical protein
MGVPITAADRMPLAGMRIIAVHPAVDSLLSGAAACVVVEDRVADGGNH